MTTTTAPAKPVPVPDEASAPFFDGALHGELMLLRCRACGTYQSPMAYIGVPARPLRDLLLRGARVGSFER